MSWIFTPSISISTTSQLLRSWNYYIYLSDPFESEFFFRLARWAEWFCRNKFSYFFYSQATSMLLQPTLLVTSLPFPHRKASKKSSIWCHYSPYWQQNSPQLSRLMSSNSHRCWEITIELLSSSDVDLKVGLKYCKFFIHIWMCEKISFPIETLKRIKENVEIKIFLSGISRRAENLIDTEQRFCTLLSSKVTFKKYTQRLNGESDSSSPQHACMVMSSQSSQLHTNKSQLSDKWRCVVKFRTLRPEFVQGEP